MEEWKSYYDEGLAYCKTVVGAKKKGNKLGNSVLYNLVGLAVESLLTSLIAKSGDLPDHSNIGSMLHLLKKSYEMPETFMAESRFYNKFMNFCGLDIAPQLEPNEEEMERIVNFLTDVKEWVEENLELSAETC